MEISTDGFMNSDSEIAQNASKKNISEIAAALGIAPEFVEPYGRDKAKIALEAARGRRPSARLVLVSAINPTPAGEGKTTCTIALGDGLNRIGMKAAIALREPSLGPVFGKKGGATGGGLAQVVPMEDINLHFTGDMHAVTSANNLICACIDNHIHYGNALDIREVLFHRCIDMNDRALRHITLGRNGEGRSESFRLTVASEIMAVLCLASDPDDLRRRLERIIVGLNSSGGEVTVGDLGVTGSVMMMLKDAMKPNLVQTLYHTPALIHGGPFANIAHGCNSVTATLMAMRYAEIVVTEAGFGADLGAEKFADIKCRAAGIAPDAIVIVATVRALKMHGGAAAETLKREDPEALRRGFENLRIHVRHMRTNFSRPVPVCAALNHFHTDSAAEVALFEELCRADGIDFAVVTSYRDGDAGGEALARLVAARIAETPAADGVEFRSCDPEEGLEKSIRTICRKFYEVSKVEFSPTALEKLKKLSGGPYGKLPVCIAKTPYALNDGSEDPELIHITDLEVAAGAGFMIVRTGSVMTMPGLPAHPMALEMDFRDGAVIGMN